MHHRYARPAVFITVLLASLGGAPARAQQTPAPIAAGPRGVYQGEREDRESPQVLLLSGSVSESHNNNVRGADSPIQALADPQFGISRFYSKADAMLFYGRRNDRVKFGASGGGTTNYYPDFDNLVQNSYQGSADITLMHRGTVLRANQSASHVPYFLFGVSPVARNQNTVDFPLVFGPVFSATPVQERQDLAVLARPTNVFTTGVSLTQGLTRRSSMDVSYGLTVNRFGGEVSDLTAQSGNLRLTKGFTRNFSIHGGYGFQDATYALVPARTKVRGQDLSIGGDYVRQLSRTRKLAVTVDGGSSILTKQDTAKTYYQAAAHAGLNYVFGRTWSAGGDFSRTLQLLEGLSEPFFGNSYAASVGNQFVRRITVIANATYSTGAVGIEAVAKGYETRTASLGVRYGLTNHIALSAQYVYYKYRFARAVELPPSLARNLNRQVVRVGLDFGIPILRARSRP